MLEDRGYDILFDRIAGELGIETAEQLPAGIELSVRRGQGKRVLFALNLTKETHDIALNSCKRHCAFTGQEASSRFSLEPGGVAILIEDL